MVVSYVYFLGFLLVGVFAAPQQAPVSIENLDNGYFFSNTRIVGGEEAEEGELQAMVAIITGTVTRTFLCGGSIISPNFILTAGHCIEAIYTTRLITGRSLMASASVITGTNLWQSGGTSYSFDRNITHPQYDGSAVKNDLGILVTSTDIQFNSLTQPVTLNYTFVSAGIPTVVFGFGRTAGNESLSSTLQKLSNIVIDGDECKDRVAQFASEHNLTVIAVDPNVEICTFNSTGLGTCNGDSGSPLITADERQQVGIVSWGFPCARGAPDMYTRISAYEDWLESAMLQ